ncbi:MAG: DUF3617 family protein [Gammaproteobacteria bacterium]|nr:DUF3617 family protein [Gammaproteobacteria bacterium]
MLKFIITSSLVFGLVSSFAAELPINPGMWETTMTRTNPLNGQEQTETTKECVKETSIKTQDFIEGQQQCKLVNDKVSGSTLTFKVDCNQMGITSSMTAEITADKDSSKGKMDIAMNMGGQEQTMSMSWTAKRLGECK